MVKRACRDGSVLYGYRTAEAVAGDAIGSRDGVGVLNEEGNRCIDRLEPFRFRFDRYAGSSTIGRPDRSNFERRRRILHHSDKNGQREQR